MASVQKKRVFIAHNNGDNGLVERYVISPLENVKASDVGFAVECVYDKTHFHPGKSTIDNIQNAIERCAHTFVVITPSSIERQWVRYETQLALERSQRSERLCVSLILIGINRAELHDVHGFRMFTGAAVLHTDQRRADWPQRLLDQMIERIKDDGKGQLGALLAWTNLAVGGVWSHFTGYTRIISPKLKERIHSSPWYKSNPACFPVFEINIIPQSAKRVGYISEWDNRIEYVGDLDDIQSGRGSFRQRPYRVSVYSIQDGDKRYYFAASVPNTFTILNQLESNSPAGARHTGRYEARPPSLTTGSRKLQVAQFYIGLNQLVNHVNNSECNNLVKFIIYDDEKRQSEHGDQKPRCENGDLFGMILKLLQTECSKTTSPSRQPLMESQQEVSVHRVDDIQYENLAEQQKHSVEIDHCGHTLSKMTLSESKDVPFYKKVYIAHCEQDYQHATDLYEFLEDNGFDVRLHSHDSVGRTELQNFELALKERKWCLFILSYEAIHDKSYGVLSHKFKMVLHESVESNEVRVIPILHGLTHEDITDDIRALTYINLDEQKKLLQILSCGKIEMETKVPAKDVHIGLAWMYVYNYLKVTIPEHLKRLEEIQKEYSQCCVVKKLFIVVPSSCTQKTLKSLDTDDEGRILDQRFKQMQEMYIYKRPVGGQVNRTYQLITYRLRANLMDYILAVEFPNSVVCLKEMADLSHLSGLEERHLQEEAYRFKELSQRIIESTPEIANHARVLYYDDDRLKLADVLLEVLETEADI